MAFSEFEEMIQTKVSSNSKHVFLVKPDPRTTLDKTLEVMDLIAVYTPQGFSLLQDKSD